MDFEALSLSFKTFLLTVHTLQKAHLNELNTFVDQFIKKLLGIPKSTTNAIVHSKQGLDIPAISAVYMEAHNVSHARTRLQVDVIVKHVLGHAVERESSYTCGRGTNQQTEDHSKKNHQLHS